MLVFESFGYLGNGITFLNEKIKLIIMNLYHLFSRPLFIHYYGRFLSEATLFYIIITLIQFLLPLIIVWRSDSFWIKESTYREMPDVDFKKNFILFIDTFNNDNKSEITYAFSTFNKLNQLFNDNHKWIPVSVSVNNYINENCF